MRLRFDLAVLSLVAGLLAACDTVEEWIDSDRNPPLPGERISVLALDAALEADPRVADLKVQLPEPYVNESWSQPGGSPNHAMYHLSLDAPLVELWRADVGEASDDERLLLSQPVVAGDRVFTMDSASIVTAFSRASGDELWRIDLEDEEEEDDGFFGGGIAYEAGRLFVTTGFARVYALDARTGVILWRQQVAGPIRAAPAVSSERVFVLTVDNQLFALSAIDGNRLWEHSGIQETAGLIGTASPAIDGSVIVVPYSSGEIFGMLAESGRILWSDSLSAIRRVDPIADLAHIRGLPVIDRGLVVAISHSGRMVAIDQRRGTRAWDIDVGGIEMPWVAGEFIFVLTNDNQVLCLTRREGRVRWVRQLDRFEDPEDLDDPIQWVGPVLAGDRLIVAGSHEKALSISPYTGEPLGELELPGKPAIAPIVADRTLYFLLENAALIALR